MNSLSSLKMKLKELDEIEKDVANSLHTAGQALLELAKEKPSMKQVESNTTNFLKNMQSIEAGLMKQILYLTQVTTVHPHEGSSYAAQKVFHMALHRLEHARSRMNELERLRQQHLSQDQQFAQNIQPPPPAGGQGFSESPQQPQQMPMQQSQQSAPNQMMPGPHSVSPMQMQPQQGPPPGYHSVPVNQGMMHQHNVMPPN